MRLNNISIRALKPPPQGAKVHYDDTLPGFGIRVTQAGAKSFVLTHGPRRQRETIGRVGILALSDARKAAKERLAEYTLGKHRPRVMSWRSALDEYLTELAAKRRPSTLKSYKRHLKKHFPFGDTRMTEIGAHDLQRDLDKLKDRPSELFHAFVSLRAFIVWAHRKHYLDKNPMERMKTPEGSTPRERILTDDELKKVWNAAGDDPFGRIVKLLILLGQRLGETSHITDEMIAKDTITFPAALTKNGRQHTIPFPETARPLLKDLSFNGFSKSKARLDKESGVNQYVLHDLRRTFASGLASLGVQLPVIEKLLNHVSGSFAGIVGVYQKYDYAKEMKAAVCLWEAHVQKLIKT